MWLIDWSLRSKDGRRTGWCEELVCGEALFIAEEGVLRRKLGLLMARPFWCSKGKGKDGVV
jgi:hypothetical protein